MFSFFSRKIEFPSPQWFQTIKEHAYTPDALKLETRSHHLVFAVGETMRCGYEHERMKPFEFCGNAFTKDVYTHWKKKLGLRSFSIPLKSDNSKALIAKDNVSLLPPVNNAIVHSTRIKGELYLVPNDSILELDMWKQNGVQFQRERISVLLPCRKLFQIKDRDSLAKKLNEPLTHSVVSVKTIQVVNAWIYHGIPEVWANELDGGYSYSPVRVFRPSKDILGTYSYFSSKEYEDL